MSALATEQKPTTQTIHKYINQILEETDFISTSVSFDDVQRFGNESSISCWGSNITDTRLFTKNGNQLFTIRSENWNERLGTVSTNELAIIVNDDSNLKTLLLTDLLKNPQAYIDSAYELESDTLYHENDNLCSIRFQTVFIPEDGAVNFATQAYNYQTTEEDDPKNTLLLCTSQGTFIQQDGPGSQNLFQHRIDPDGNIRQYWNSAEATKFKVGQEQKETPEESGQAAACGKAEATPIGIREMGKCMNVVMTIQLPIKQKPREARSKGLYESDAIAECAPMSNELSYRSLSFRSASIGKSYVARISRGDEEGEYPGLGNKNPIRHDHEHPTITVIFYYVVKDGVPSVEDTMKAVQIMEEMYTATSGKNIKEMPHMKAEATPEAIAQIAEKIKLQPWQPPAQTVTNSSFPSLSQEKLQ